MKRRLLLLRHAKASRGSPELADEERPLSRRGRAAASALGGWLARRRVRIDRVLCSPSRRTRETLALLALAPEIPVAYVDALYLASARTLLARLRRLPPRVHTVLVVGHDPGLDQLARSLAEQGRGRALALLEAGFPTGSLAELRVPEESWAVLAAGSAELTRFTRPRDL